MNYIAISCKLKPSLRSNTTGVKFRSTLVHSRFLVGFVFVRSLVFCVTFRRSLFVRLSFFFWPLYCLSSDLRLLSSGHCIVCPPTYGFFLLAIVLSVLRLTASFFWSLYCLSSVLRFFLLVIVLSVLRLTASEYSFGIFKILSQYKNISAIAIYGIQPIVTLWPCWGSIHWKHITFYL